MENELIKKMYSEKNKFLLEDGTDFNIPLDGSLGVLALGYKGLIAWRKKKINSQKRKKKIKDNE
jgi:hypothetical protein